MSLRRIPRSRRIRTIPLLAALLAAILPLVAVAAAGAQTAPAPRVEFIRAVRTAHITDSLGAGVLHVTQLGRTQGLTSLLVRRDSSGLAETHAAVTDLLVVQRGSATLRHGGTLEGSRETEPGERRGGAIRGGSETRIVAGDVVIVPAGVPHHIVLGPGESVTYLAFKPAVSARPITP